MKESDGIRERKSICEIVIAEFFCEMCFNEGNHVHDSVALYTTGSVIVHRENTDRTEKISSSSFAARLSFSCSFEPD